MAENYIDPDSIPEQFKAIYKAMKPNLPRVAPIRVSALKNAKNSELTHALKWICAIQRGPYAEMMNVIKCMPPERWALLEITHPDLEEIVLRRTLERTLRLVWAETMPSILKASKHVEQQAGL